MATGNQLPEGFVLDSPAQAQTGLPEGFVLDAPVEAAPVQVPQKEPGFFDMVTGESRMTPQMEAVSEIGDAPELNALSVPAFKASLGLMATGKTEELKNILTQQFGQDVSFEADEMGNTIVNLPSGQYALNKPGLSGQDIVRGAMDFAAFTPAGRVASIPAAVAKNAATQAVIEGAGASVGGEFDPVDVGVSGVIGGAFKGLENVAGAGYRAAKGAPADATVQAGLRENIPIMTSDVLPPQTFAGKTAQQTTEKIPLVGTAGMRERQQAARETAVNQVINKYGEFSYPAIVNSLKAQKNKVKNAAGSVLEGVGKKLDGAGEIPLTNTKNAIQSVKGEMTKKGVISSEGAIGDLQTLIDALDSAPQTFSTLKENRTAFREIVKGADKVERTQLTSRAKSLLSSVERAMKKDMDAQAKANLTSKEFAKWTKANKVYADEATKLTKTKLKNILDKGDVTPEAVQTMLFSQKPSEVKNLYNSLTVSGKANARSAIISKVIGNLNKRASGVTPTSFASEMKKFGLQTDTFFKGDEKKALNGLLKALNATRRAQEAGVTTPTGQSLISLLTIGAATTAPVSTATIGGTLGTTARLYESPAVRDALIRLHSIQPRSTQFEKALLDLETVLNASVQSGVNSEGGQ